MPNHCTLLTCVTAIVRTTAVLTRPHTHPLNTALQKTPLTNRLTDSHKQCTRISITLVECSKREQKELVEKDEVVERAALLGIHRPHGARAPRRRAWRAWRAAGRRR